jgi:hypothetical protein
MSELRLDCASYRSGHEQTAHKYADHWVSCHGNGQVVHLVDVVVGDHQNIILTRWDCQDLVPGQGCTIPGLPGSDEGRDAQKPTHMYIAQST